jgi:uncharacterized repeat protein (TIGR03803 family)
MDSNAWGQFIFTPAIRRKGDAMTKSTAGRIICIVALFCVATSVASSAQTFSSIASFMQNNGANPFYGPLVQGPNGDFYGTTYAGGTCLLNGGCGTVFEVTPGGDLMTVYDFCLISNCADGELPTAGLVLATNGNFYGTASRGGTNKDGSAFEITPSGTFTSVYNFCAQPHCTDGANPEGLLQAANGNFYGLTSSGGGKHSGEESTGGTVVEITPAGELTTLHAFCSTLESNGNCADGQGPVGALVQASSGIFYGTTLGGGPSTASQCTEGCGTVFSITASGKLTTLYSFCPDNSTCVDGAHPSALIQATDGNFYGAAHNGGANGWGTVFKITPEGALTTVYNFCSQSNCSDGFTPSGPLVQATDGNFYGIAGGGPGGEIFELTGAGELTKLYSFCSQAQCTDGSSPSTLMQATNGAFYGLTGHGGTDTAGCGGEGCGSVFSLATGLGPFVETTPKAAKVGAGVGILGNNLTGTTAVTFNGTAAEFRVVSSTLIEAKIPTGATTGTIEVTTPGGTLSSNVAFTVEP